MSNMLIFAYGSNMSCRRLKNRCASALIKEIAFAEGYKLMFNKKSSDGSAKANIQKTDTISLVWGVMYEISQEDKSELDRIEGKGYGYEEQFIFVKTAAGDLYECICYIVMDKKYTTDDSLPYDWYLNHCITGAAENNLPKEYVSFLQKHATKMDGDTDRNKKEKDI